MWATDHECDQRFLDTTFDEPELEYLREYGFVPRVTTAAYLDDGTQFANLRVVGPGGTVMEHHFAHERALEDCASFIRAMEEGVEMPLEERLAPFGPEWEREQREERGRQ